MRLKENHIIFLSGQRKEALFCLKECVEYSENMKYDLKKPHWAKQFNCCRIPQLIKVNKLNNSKLFPLHLLFVLTFSKPSQGWSRKNKRRCSRQRKNPGTIVCSIQTKRLNQYYK